MRLLGLLAALAFLLAPAAVSAAPAWLAPASLSASGASATDARVAMDEAGETIALWQRGGAVQASIRQPGGAFSAPQELSPSASTPALAMTPTGEALVAWRHFDGSDYVFEASTRPPGGAFSAPLEVATVQAGFSPALAVALNAAGDAAVAWQRREGAATVIQASTRPAGGAFSAPADLSEATGDASEPQVALDPAGDALIAWQSYDAGAPDPNVIQATSGSGATYAPAQTLSSAENAVEPRLAIGAAGAATLVWSAYATPEEGTPVIGSIQASTRPPGGPFSAPVNLSDPGRSAFQPALAMTPAGEACVVWISSDGAGDVVTAAKAPPGAGFSAPIEVAALGSSGADPDPAVAVNPGGAATIAWQRSDGESEVVQASTAPPGGGFGAPDSLSAAGEDAIFPTLAMDGQGDATALWQRSDGTDEIVQAAGYDADAPVFRGLSIPSRGTVGVPVSFSASPFDVWPLASTAFSFGDGATAQGASVSHAYAAPGTYPVTVSAADAAGTTVGASAVITIVPSNEFVIGRLSRNRRRGTATLAVTVPGPGSLVLAGAGVRAVDKRPRRAGSVKLSIVTRGKTSRTLLRHGRARLTLKISFTPSGGAGLAKHKVVTLIEKRLQKRSKRIIGKHV